MVTPWGNLRVCDAHVHFFSHHFFETLLRQKGEAPSPAAVVALGPVLGWEMPEPEPDRLAERWIHQLDRHGVVRAAIIGSVPGDEDSIAAAVARAGERLIGYVMLDPRTPDSVERTRRALGAGLSGICLFPAMHRYSLADDRVEGVVEVIRSRPGTVVFVHCGVLTVGIRQKLGLASPFDMRYSNPIDLHALALRFPSVPFVIPHFGAGFFREALMVADLCPNIYLDTSSSNSWMRYQEAGCDLKSVFRRALEVAGPGRLLFGTDSSYFPRGWNREVFDAQVVALRRAGAGTEAARAVLGGNLERLVLRAAAMK